MIWVDASVWLEIALNQERAEQCLRFFKESTEEKLFTSDFDIYSMILTLLKYKKSSEEVRIFLGVLENLSLLTVFRPTASIVLLAVAVMEEKKLTFDDALAYASMLQLQTRKIATLDRDFKKLDLEIVL